jgi:hypothetical protein
LSQANVDRMMALARQAWPDILRQWRAACEAGREKHFVAVLMAARDGEMSVSLIPRDEFGTIGLPETMVDAVQKIGRVFGELPALVVSGEYGQILARFRQRGLN